MIPLMVQQDYKPQGWLGLILGTRMWYAMWEAEQDDDAADGGERVAQCVRSRGPAVVLAAQEARVAQRGVAAVVEGHRSRSLADRLQGPCPLTCCDDCWRATRRIALLTDC